MKRSRLARVVWLGLRSGAEELSAGNARVATRHLWQSLCLHVKQPTTVMLLFMSLFPQRLLEMLRVVKRSMRRLSAPITGILLAFVDDGVLFQLTDLVQSGLT